MGAVKEYDCPNCGGPLTFKPELSGWKCDYCFSQFDKEQIDEIYGTTKEEHLQEVHEELDTYHCESCGAELIADETTTATFCLYCKSPSIIKQRFEGDFQPAFVIPFKVSQDKAKSMYSEWIKKKFFAPTAFKLDDEIEKVTGMYAPFWLFDCDAHGKTVGKATKVSSWRAGDYQYTKTKNYHVEREGNIRYERIPVDGSKKLDDDYMTMIEPYNYKELKDFSMSYLSGFLAERYDVDASESGKIMQARAESFVKDRLRGTVGGYSSYIPTSTDAQLKNVVNNYALMPIYILVNKYKGQDYKFFVNGQSGKIVGNAPIDHKRQALFFGAVAGIVWVLTVFGGAFFA